MSEKHKSQLIKLVTFFLLVSLIFTLFSSCSASEIIPLGDVDEYISRYNTVATSFGFSRIVLSDSDSGIYGFSAFDRLFIVALSADNDGRIYSIEVSTGASYAQTLTDDAKFNEAVIYAAAIVSPIFSDQSLDNSEISTLAGKILYSEQKQIKIPKSNDSYVYCKMTRAANGGFEIILKATPDTP